MYCNTILPSTTNESIVWVFRNKNISDKSSKSCLGFQFGHMFVDLISLKNSTQKLLVNTISLSDTIVNGMPCNLNTSFVNTWASLEA